ncbi:MAG: GNAT family N-acetyltransferase [Patescibacteria group bacterium]
MNITIRPLQEKDAYTSVNWRNDPSIWTHTEFSATRKITIEDELNWIKKVMADKSCRRFAILADSDYIGNTYLTDIDGGGADFHIFIGDKSYWGKGVAKKASKLVIDFAKNELGLNIINLGVKSDNIPALSIYKSLGFTESGVKDGFLRMKLDLRTT